MSYLLNMFWLNYIVCSYAWLSVIFGEHACIEMWDKMFFNHYTFLKEKITGTLWTYMCCDKVLVQSNTLIMDSTMLKSLYRFCEHVLCEILRWKEFQSDFSCVSRHCEMHIRLCSVVFEILFSLQASMTIFSKVS